MNQIKPPDFVSSQFKANPFPFYARLRAEAPAYRATVTLPFPIDATGESPPRVIEGLRKLGAFGMKIPKKYGGPGVRPA